MLFLGSHCFRLKIFSPSPKVHAHASVIAIKMLLQCLFIAILIWAQQSQQAAPALYKCSNNPDDGLNTYSFTTSQFSGVVCLKWQQGDSNMVFYIDSQLTGGNANSRSVSAGIAALSSDGKYYGNMYPLYPISAPQQITITINNAIPQATIGMGAPSNWLPQPSGTIWTPTNPQAFTGCANGAPQLTLPVNFLMPQVGTNGVICAIASNPQNGYDGVYGFGTRVDPVSGPSPFVFVGTNSTPLSGTSLSGLTSNLYDVCQNPDYTKCTVVYKNLRFN
jgi:hypothetical protein